MATPRDTRDSQLKGLDGPWAVRPALELMLPCVVTHFHCNPRRLFEILSSFCPFWGHPGWSVPARAEQWAWLLLLGIYSGFLPQGFVMFC